MKVTKLDLPFGQSRLSARVRSPSLVGVFTPREFKETPDEQALIRSALQKPIGTPRLRELAQRGRKVVIVTSDLTRPCPSPRLIPSIVDELEAGGIASRDITIVIALGLHRARIAAQLETFAGLSLCGRVQVINHDPMDTVPLGVTSAGTPVELLQRVAAADLRVCLGNIEFHYFAGYSGGAKAILPGCASEATIKANHAMMVHPGAVAGQLDGNPVRADLEEGAAMLGVDFILNVVLNSDHRIVGAFAGDATAAHRQGCQMVAQRGLTAIPKRSDIVLVSAGGRPQDVNLYQAQKALDNASQAVRDGGILIWVAECREGFGNATFESWLRGSPSPADLLDRFHQGFVLGAHKAAAIARVLSKARVYLVSALAADVVRSCGMLPFDDLESALREAFAELGPNASVSVLPYGSSILLREEANMRTAL